MRAHTRPRASRSGFTLTELTVTLAASAGLLTVGCMMLGVGAQPDADSVRAANIQLKDATQIRGIGQAFIIYAQNNGDSYPLPSRIDLQNATVAAAGAAKDTTANIMSMLIYTGFVSTDLMVSPAESSANVRVNENYQFVNPAAAPVAAQALWDPAFSVDFTGNSIGNLSYAHQIPAGERLTRWSTTFSATEPIVGNRGPQVAAVREAGETVPRDIVPIYASKSSMTFKIHGGPDTWEGNTGYNDNHVSYETSPAPGDVHYTSMVFNPEANNNWNQARARDVLFFDEPDAVKNDNAYLGIFTHAGPATKNFRAIWD